MDQFNHSVTDFSKPVTYQRFVEACKFGFAKRTLLGDWNDDDMRPAMESLVEELTAPASAIKTKAAIRDDWTSEDPSYYGAEYATKEDEGTSHMSVFAENGDAVAITSTANGLFGTGLVSPKTGIIFNNDRWPIADFDRWTLLVRFWRFSFL